MNSNEQSNTPTATWRREDLWSISSAAEERAQQRNAPFRNYEDGYCTACGRRLSAVAGATLMVEVHIDGHVILPDDPISGDWQHPCYQGTWEIGPECAKRVLTQAEIRAVRAAQRP